jgi:chromosomal replication initiation ATPase DnaA
MSQPASPALAHELWPLLRPYVDRATFAAWIGRCQVMESGPELLHLMAPSGFVARHIEQEWGALLTRVTGARELVVEEAMP